MKPCRLAYKAEFQNLQTSTLIMEAAYSPETSVSTYKITCCHNPEDHNPAVAEGYTIK
jgi:hypothetical protein